MFIDIHILQKGIKMKKQVSHKIIFFTGILILLIIVITACNNPTDDLNGEPATREFSVSFNFYYNDGQESIINAKIQDNRIQPGSQTLQQMGIVKQIEDAVMVAFETFGINPPLANGLRNAFGVEGGVTIIVDNPATPYKMKATDNKTMYFHINYLRSNNSNPTDIEQHIWDAVRAMIGVDDFTLPHEVY